LLIQYNPMRFFSLLTLLILFACQETKTSSNTIAEENGNSREMAPFPKLDSKAADNLANLPIACIQNEYPNKLGQVLGGNEDLKSPKELHPAFYGCFDWHSAVHGHWSLVSLLKQFPELEEAKSIKMMLQTNLSKENIEQEVTYFEGKHNKSFERTYGWAWLLKLAEELHTWDDPIAKDLSNNLQPLTKLIIQKYLEFLPKLNYPIRVGEHTNTAFGLSFAYDYAITLNHIELKNSIETRAKEFYLQDHACPITWEPSGFDFLSPCLEEAALLRKILPKEEFKVWFEKFLPQLTQSNFQLAVGEVSDRTDGKLVHLDGVNFSRAWCLNTIANGIPEYKHLKNLANQHINYSLPNLVGDSYEGGHWLGSFAIYALNTVEK